MEPVLFESILFGELRPWANAGVGSAPKETAGPGLPGILEPYPAIHNRVKGMPVNELEAVKPFVTADIAEPFGRDSLWYQKLIRLEGRRLLCSVIQTLEPLEDDVDRQYEVNCAIREAVDLLKECADIEKKRDDRLSQYVLELVSRHLMMLVLDLSLRYADLEEVDRYDETSLYPAVLDKPAPERSPFARTPAYRAKQLRRLIVEKPLGGAYGDLRRIIVRELKEGEEESKQELKGLLVHLENAAFLRAMKAAFIEDAPDKLLDETFCREWVTGIHRDFMEERDVQKAAELFNELSEAEQRFKRAVGMDVALDGDLRLRRSEAVELLMGVGQIREDSFGKADMSGGQQAMAVASDGEGASFVSDFVESFRSRFITVDEFKDALKAGDRSVRRYLKESDIRVLEVSTNIKFLYREDVEAFFEERTVGDQGADD